MVVDAEEREGCAGCVWSVETSFCWRCDCWALGEEWDRQLSLASASSWGTLRVVKVAPRRAAETRRAAAAAATAARRVMMTTMLVMMMMMRAAVLRGKTTLLLLLLSRPAVAALEAVGSQCLGRLCHRRACNALVCAKAESGTMRQRNPADLFVLRAVGMPA